MSETFNTFANYLHDVFITQFDGWVILGFVAQGFFTMRFVVQWIASERARKSVIHCTTKRMVNMACATKPSRIHPSNWSTKTVLSQLVRSANVLAMICPCVWGVPARRTVTPDHKVLQDHAMRHHKAQPPVTARPAVRR